jgi:hypothetical protein
MKKQYIIPTLDVIKIQPYVLQAGVGSLEMTGNPATTNSDGDYDDSRSFSLGLWGDNEE